MREFTDGSTAIVRGALAAGCDFFAGYPITPASPILMMMMRELPKVGGIAIQAEDEIASTGMCIGAAMGGSRVLTATSGPGISLYSEHIGMAIMGEVPMVIVDVQRLGPATGGATTVGQGDVQFVRWGTGGGYPVIVLAPSSVLECHELTMKAFDLSERFRCPVFLLTDKELNLTTRTVEADAYKQVPVRERVVARREARGTDAESFAPYRYDPPEAVAPMAQYGTEDVVRFTGSTHDEQAYITKNTDTVERLNRHLELKIENNRDEIEMGIPDLEDGATTLLLSYGVTAGAMREAVATARSGGRKVSALTVQSLWPVPETLIHKAAAGIGREIERLLKDVEVEGLTRVDGELISPDQFLEVIR